MGKDVTASTNDASGSVPMAQIVRDRVQAEMDARKWAQIDLCEVTGLTPSKVSRFLAGRVSLDVDDLDLIAKAFGRKAGDFLPNSHSITPELARLADRLSGLSGPERYHILEMLEGALALRDTTLSRATELFAGGRPSPSLRAEARA